MITLTKKEVLNLNTAIGAVANLKGLDVAFFYTKNKRVLKDNAKTINSEIDKIQKSYSHVDKKLKEFNNCHQELIIKHAKKDDKGEKVQVKGDNDIEDIKAFEKEYLELKDVKFKATFDEQAKGRKEVEDHLEKKVQIDLSKLNKDKLPSDITGQQLEGIMCVINE